jgi:hypothetical protein
MVKDLLIMALLALFVYAICFGEIDFKKYRMSSSYVINDGK